MLQYSAILHFGQNQWNNLKPEGWLNFTEMEELDKTLKT